MNDIQPLCPAQQRAFDQLAARLELGPLFHLQGAMGRRKTTVLRTPIFTLSLMAALSTGCVTNQPTSVPKDEIHVSLSAEQQEAVLSALHRYRDEEAPRLSHPIAGKPAGTSS